VFVAALLAVPIGLDRELRGKAAGLRTHVVMATAAAALGYLSVLSAPLSATGADGTRIASQVVTGVGFIGAGVIFASSGRVHGLTTAAALFSATATGLCAGLNQLPLALALTAVTLLFLWPVDQVTKRLIRGFAKQERVVHLVAPDLTVLSDVQRLLAQHDTPAREIAIEPLAGAVSARLTINCRPDRARQILAAVAALEGVQFLSDEAFAPAD
jgi:putative Mg2+ transporter-C (MgtC) family protein